MSEDRADRVRNLRSERSQRDDASDTDESDQTSNTSESSQASNTPVTDEKDKSSQENQTSLRDQTHVAMYLEEDLAEDLDLRFDELNLQYRKEHGEKMTKNGVFYPALARAAINNTTIEEELGLSEE